MRVHYLQHVPFEDLGVIEQILAQRGHGLRGTTWFNPRNIPLIDDYDCLIVLGGPMGVDDESAYPWLAREKRVIEAAFRQGKIILGICLGAQLIARVLGARVYKNKHKEIGWFDIEINQEISHTVLAEAFSQRHQVFHWHGDTFDLPKGAVPIAESEACPNQGFILGDRIVGLQFHLESTPRTVKQLIAHCKDDIDGSRYVQSGTRMLSDPGRFSNANHLMAGVLDALLPPHAEQDAETMTPLFSP